VSAARGSTSSVALIEGLQRKAAYPHPVEEPIRVTETHISSVLLTGEYAYKIKKPVSLSFLDYGTLVRRRQFCEEELRLNRRLAPSLYLDVCVIAGTPAAPRVGAAGPAIEYAVRMRQFDVQDELTALLSAGAASTGDLAALGAAVAAFHAAAAVPAADSPFGEPARLHRVTLDNFTELHSLPEAREWSASLATLERGIEARYDASRECMAARRGLGRIRECHGDLHCGNVVRWKGALTPFDGIEFDPALRFIDVASDVAFLTMDLAERGHAGLCRAFLQAWCETLGDWTAVALLPYYETYRALVRAKVAALRALQLARSGPDRTAAVRDAARYVDWARSRLEARRPTLFLTCGLSGSGKTWFARQLGARRGALHLRSDVERRRLAGLAPGASSGSPPQGGIYTREFNERTYAWLMDCAGAALTGGESIVVDAAFLRRGERLAALELANRQDCEIVILHCRAPMTILRERVAARSAAQDDASEAGLAVLARQPDLWEPFAGEERAVEVEVDTTDAAAVESVLGRLSGRADQPAPPPGGTGS
jgi:aminoglycoside phosphotransferase family enzyme/predicted kinase